MASMIKIGVPSLLLLSCLAQAAEEPRPPLARLLEPGPHAVGYRVWHRHDSSRPFGQAAERPVQISIWYPAESAADGERLTLEAYLGSAATEIDFDLVDERSQRRAVERVRALALAGGSDATRFDQAAARETGAVRERKPRGGSFPLILFAPGQGGPAFQAVALSEHLASHGYVVAAIPSVGKSSREIESEPEGLEANVGDLELALGEMRKFPGADGDRVGVIGYSFGGMAATLLAMGHPEVAAVVALDPGFRVAGNQEIWRGSPRFDPARLRQPMLVLLARGVGGPPDLSFLDGLGSSDVQLLGFPDLRHGDFASVIVELFLHTQADGGGRDPHRVDLGHATACRYARSFLDAHLKGDGEARAFLTASPAAHGIPAGVVTLEERR